MGTALDSLVGTLPVILVGGTAMKMTEGMFSKAQEIGTAYRSSSQWQSLTKKEAYNLIGKKKANLLQENPGRVYTTEYDKLKFENGQFWLV